MIRIALIPLLLSLAPLPALAAQDSFTPAQRAEIVAVMRDALQHDPTLLRDAITALQKQETAEEATETRQAIVSNHAALVANPADPAFGDPRADVSVVVFLDPRCPYCRNMLPVLAELLRREPHVRLVYKDIPILGPLSMIEARALVAAQKQNGYARLQDVLMRPGSPAIADQAGVLAAARGTGLDPQRLATDMADADVAARLDGNLKLTSALGIHGTPALVIGDQMISGATDLPTLRQAIAAARHG